MKYLISAGVGAVIVVLGYLGAAIAGLPFLNSLIVTIPLAFVTGLWIGMHRG